MNAHFRLAMQAAILATAAVVWVPQTAHAGEYPTAQAAIDDAGRKATYACVVFCTEDNAQAKAMAGVAQDLNKTRKKKAVVHTANLANKADADLGAKYGVSASQPLPLLLVVAYNGVVTGGYPQNVTAEQLTKSTSVPELTLKVLKPLQEQKVALVALQNQATKSNVESWKAVKDFSADPQYGKFVAAVKADPAAAGSQDFLTQCGLKKEMAEATVVVLLPPASIGKVLTGKITKDDLLKSLQACAPGSGGKGGCCSDRRFKQNIAPIDSALEKVSKLQGVSYTWDRVGYPFRDFPEGTQVGLIAQDVERVVPEVVRTDADGYRYLHYDKLTAVLVEALKELKQQVRVQDSVVEAQNGRIEALEAAGR